MTKQPTDPAIEYTSATVMQAIGMTRFSKIGKVADELKMLTVPVPRPASGEVAIQIAASSMHIDEIFAAQGTALGRFYGPKNVSTSNPALLASCATGTIVGLGEGAEKFKIGDEVIVVIVIPSEHPQAGSWANYPCFGEQWLLHKPSKLTHVEAAAVTMATCVAWRAIGFAKIKPGDQCLVVGASGQLV